MPEGIKETKEAVVGVLEISVFIAERLKDGIGIDDAFAVFDKLKNDEAFKAKLVTAYQGYEKIPAEAADIDAAEAVELGIVALGYVPKILNTLKKG